MDLADIVGLVEIRMRGGLAIHANQVSVDIPGPQTGVNTLVTGKIIKRMVLESTYTQTRVFTSGIIITIDPMVLEFTNGQMEIFIKVNGRTELGAV